MEENNLNDKRKFKCKNKENNSTIRKLIKKNLKLFNYY